MTVYKVKVTKQAYKQMREIVHYIANELLSPEAAVKLIDKMQEAVKGLSEFPKKYSIVDEEPWRSAGVRKIVVKNFLIYFWVDDENMRVQVTAVIYSKRNQLVQLAKMDWE
jgi:toxin ParE1/3/4